MKNQEEPSSNILSKLLIYEFHYEKYHLHDHVYSKVDVDTKISIVNNYFIHCLFHKDIEHQKILFYGTMSELLIPFNILMNEVTLYVQETDNT